MKYLIIVLTWLQKMLAQSVLTSIIVILLAIALAAIANELLEKEFTDLNQLIIDSGISTIEYWVGLVLVFAVFLFAVVFIESVITNVMLTKFSSEEKK